jgi:small subunit ribosomal protein S1
MVNRNLIRNLDDDDISAELALLAPEEEADEWLIEWLNREQQDYAQGEIVEGRIVEVNDEWALIDVGFKSEGTVALSEWGSDEKPPKVGDYVTVLIEEMEDELGAADDPYGMISLSKNKAQKILEWEKIIGQISEGQVVTGTVIRKIKGGLLVNIGVNVFLPGSQVDPTQYRHQSSLADRTSARRRQSLLDEGIGSRSGPQGYRQEHRRLRCVRGLGRYRRSVAHHRYGLGAN